MESILEILPGLHTSPMEPYQKAIEILHQACTPDGFVTSIAEHDHYGHISTRDTALCGLASLTTDDDDLKQAFKRSIETIFQHQHKNGFIPDNVNPALKQVSYGTSVGRVDNHAWFVISACTYAYAQKERQWLRKFRTAIDTCFSLMSAWEFNGRCLMYIPQNDDLNGGHHGYILYNQLLRIWALRCAAKVFKNSTYSIKASRLRIAVENYFTGNEFYSLKVERTWQEKQFPYWITGFNPTSVYTEFNLQANALALLLKIGSNEQQQQLVQFMQGLYEEKNTMLPLFYPEVIEDKRAVPEQKTSHGFHFQKAPEHGGLWPVWNGMAALGSADYDKSFSEKINDAIIKACCQHNFGFNEYYLAETNDGIGLPNSACSAAGLIFSKNTNFISRLVL